MTLDDLGPRICIVGPSGSGKSTLTKAIAKARGLNPVYLDQLHHLPHTDWQPRPFDAFAALHDEAIEGDRWVMDGNYSRCLPQRLARATGVIQIDLPAGISLWRYLRRSWFEPDRPGALEGGDDRVKWVMIHHIMVASRANRKRQASLFDSLDLPKIRLATPRQLASFYRTEGLTR